MYAIQQLHWQGENERKETHALQSVWLTLLWYSSMNETEQANWNFSCDFILFFFCFFVSSYYLLLLSPPFPLIKHKHLPEPPFPHRWWRNMWTSPYHFHLIKPYNHDSFYIWKTVHYLETVFWSCKLRPDLAVNKIIFFSSTVSSMFT